MVEEHKRKVSKKKYTVVFVFTALVFLVGIAIGWQFSNYLLSEITQNENVLRARLFGLELKYDLLKKGDICEISSSELWEDRVELGNQLDALEKRVGKEDTQLLIQKEYYQLVEIETWLLLERINEECDSDVNIILFFYTNKKDDDKGKDTVSEEQGVLLDTLYKKFGDSIAVFAFDVNTDNPALNSLRDMYDIDTAPTLVINGEVYEGYRGYSQMVNILGFED